MEVKYRTFLLLSCGESPCQVVFIFEMFCELETNDLAAGGHGR